MRFDLEPDTPGLDLVVTYDDKPGVLYRDRLGAVYEAVTINELPAQAENLAASDVNHDGRTDLMADGRLLLNRSGKFEIATRQQSEPAASALADFDGAGKLDRALFSTEAVLILKHVRKRSL